MGLQGAIIVPPKLDQNCFVRLYMRTIPKVSGLVS